MQQQQMPLWCKQPLAGPTRSPLRQLGAAALSALSSLASAASSGLNVLDADKEEEPDDSLVERPMPPDYDGYTMEGVLYLTHLEKAWAMWPQTSMLPAGRIL
jgi:hypothetical protein